MLLVIASVSALLLIIYDNNEIEFNYQNQYDSLSTAMGKDLNSSLEAIYETNYSNNKIEFDFEIDEINNYIVEAVRSSVNKDYLIEEDYIIDKSGFKLDSIFLFSENGQIGAKAKFTVFNVYHTTLALKAHVCIDNNKILYISFDEFNLGASISIDKQTISNIFNEFDFTISKELYFDSKTLTLSLDFEKMIDKYLNDNLLLFLLKSCESEMIMKESSIGVSIDTSKMLIDKYTDNKVLTECNIKDRLENSYDGDEAVITLTEGELNYIIHNSYNDLLNFDETITMGDSEFIVGFCDMYYSISQAMVISNYYINNVYSNSKVYVMPSVERNDNVYLSLKRIDVEIGEIKVTSFDKYFKSIIVDEKVLGISDIARITDIEIDSFNSSVNIKLRKI